MSSEKSDVMSFKASGKSAMYVVGLSGGKNIPFNLVIRKEPGDSAEIVGYVPNGNNITSRHEITNGWLCFTRLPGDAPVYANTHFVGIKVIHESSVGEEKDPVVARYRSLFDAIDNVKSFDKIVSATARFKNDTLTAMNETVKGSEAQRKLHDQYVFASGYHDCMVAMKEIDDEIEKK